MKFLMFVCTDPEPDTAPDPDATPVDDWVARHDAAGTRLLGDRISPESETRVVRKRDGRVVVTAGPYAESTEWIVGFDVLECPDLDAAIAVAAEHEMARGGRIELRPFWDGA
ncbi:hypothetical protein FE634_19870 [Nocardioides dongxiaopingii]|uniref:YciI family protein n=1 Tax=Nocardioides TaxID=1839 RepID=UPI0010C76749|nr:MULTISPECIES: YciI family protein [Nocardioides]QCW52108.1 hypothetical protein FE634_19870 [Nocardioides sp. S-1144]